MWAALSTASCRWSTTSGWPPEASIATRCPPASSKWAVARSTGPKGAPMTRFSALALVLLAASTAQAAEKKFDKTFTVAPGGTLLVDADGASVRVTGGDTNQVTVHMRLKGGDKEVDGTSLDATQNG